MKKVLFGIFAHPDDEAFGPSGTLIKMARSGVNIHLICLTRGEAGVNSNNDVDLGAVRKLEWERAGQLIGATSMQQFDFGDGTLCNARYHDIAASIEHYIQAKLHEYQAPVEVEFLTFDSNGLSGHLDHIAASVITSYIFVRLAHQPVTTHHFTRVRYFCLRPSTLDNNVSFVYWPAGRNPEQIDETIDVSGVFEAKLAVMQAHQSQQSDMAMWLDMGDSIKQESFYFLQLPTDQES